MVTHSAWRHLVLRGPERVRQVPLSFECCSFHRKSIPRCRRINRMLSNESLHPPTFSRSNSQASVDSSTSVEEFWKEISSIKESSIGGQEEQSPTAPAEVKPVDGKRWCWICPVGFPHPDARHRHWGRSHPTRPVIRGGGSCWS